MICKNQYCKIEFEPKRSRQIFCCVQCQKQYHNTRQYEDYRSQRLESKKEFSICPKCRKQHKRSNSGKWRFCAKCEENIKKYGITDTKSEEYRVVV